MRSWIMPLTLLILHSFLYVTTDALYIKNLEDSNVPDLLESPIFDGRPESKSLQQIKTGLGLLKQENDVNLVQPTTTVSRESKKELLSTLESPNLKKVKQILSKFLSTLKRNKRKTKSGENKGSKWFKWTDWSPCSVSCGKGRVIRWRHCKDNCGDLETEMEERSCQLPECPRKLFGVIKLD